MTRRPKGRGLLGGLASVLTTPEIRPIPPQAELDALLKLCRELLPTLPGWPEARYRSLRALRIFGDGGQKTGSARQNILNIPGNSNLGYNSENLGSAIAETPAAAPFRRDREPDWLEDFGGNVPPRRTPLRAPEGRPEYKKKPSPSTGRPAWMDDFE